MREHENDLVKIRNTFLLWSFVIWSLWIIALPISWLFVPFTVLSFISPWASCAVVITQAFRDTRWAETESEKKIKIEKIKKKIKKEKIIWLICFYKFKQFYLISRWLELVFDGYKCHICNYKFLFKGNGLPRWLCGKDSACKKMRVWSLGQEDPLEKEMAL